MSEISVVRTVAALRETVAGWRRQGEPVGLVPTMGAIHAGHLALVAAARAGGGRVVASLFVNPKQFGPAEDFGAYPRDEAADFAAFAGAGVDAVFSPGVAEMYPPGFGTTVQVGAVTAELEGAHRPGHFEGVATVVTKLLLQCLPDAAYFGEKDYQQLTVISRMARDLDIPVRIEGVPTIREPDGLALSSRNVYLSPDERRIAPTLHRVMQDCAAALRAAPREIAPDEIAPILAAGAARLNGSGFRVDYLELRDAADLSALARFDRPARLLVAAHLGRTRLIDNIAVSPA